MNKVDLKTFVKTGRLSGLEFGISTKDDLFRAFGKTKDISKGFETLIYRYGWYEFFVWEKNNIVYAFQNDHLISDCINHKEMISFKNEKVDINPWFLTEEKDCSYLQLKEFLKQENITFSEQINKHNTLIIILDNNISFDFDIPVKEKAILNAIRLFTYE